MQYDFNEYDMENMKKFYLPTEEALYALLDAEGYPAEAFTYPWKCECPI